MNKNEIHLTICGIKLFRLCIGIGMWQVDGEPGYVDAEVNFFKWLKYKKWLRAMYHTHPTFTNQYSSLDELTFKAQSTAFGEKLLFFIEGTNGIACYSVYSFEAFGHVAHRSIYKEEYKIHKVNKLFWWIQ